MRFIVEIDDEVLDKVLGAHLSGTQICKELREIIGDADFGGIEAVQVYVAEED